MTATDDKHILAALEKMTAPQVAAWRQHCHLLSQQHEGLSGALTALAAIGFDSNLVAVSIAFSRLSRASLLELALLLERVRNAETDPDTRKVWHAVRNLGWDVEMAADPIGAEFLNPTQGDLGVSW